MEFFRSTFIDRPIKDLAMPFAAVATTLHTGVEIWLREGSTIEAVRASIAFPALFAPAVHDGRLLVDGGLVNPVPVSLARAMGADIVIAVDLSSDIIGRHLREGPELEIANSEIREWKRKLQKNLSALIPLRQDDESRLPSMLDVVTSSINIMQVRITRSRMAGEPPDVTVAPRLAHLGLLDFHRAKEAIGEGERAVKVMIPNLTALFNQSPLG